MFNDLREKLNMDSAKEGIKIVSSFCPTKVIRKRKQMNESLRTDNCDTIVEDQLAEESMEVHDLNASLNRLSLNNSKRSSDRHKISTQKMKCMDFVIELHLIKFFELGNENFVMITIKNLSAHQQNTLSNHQDQSMMAEKSFFKSNDRVMTYNSLSNLATKKYQSKKLSFSWYFQIIKKIILVFFAVQLASVIVLLTLTHSYMEKSIMIMEVVRLESIKQRHFVESYISIQNAQYLRNTTSSDQVRKDLMEANRKNLVKVKVNENRFIKLLNVLLHGDPNGPKMMIGTPEFIQAKWEADTFFTLNMTETNIIYPIDVHTMTPHLMFLMDYYFNGNSTDPYSKVTINFPYMLLTLRSLLSGVVMTIMPSLESIGATLQDLTYFFIALLIFKEAVVMMVIRFFQKKIEYVYQAFAKITKKDALQYLKLISAFHCKFNFHVISASVKSVNGIGSRFSARDDQELSQEMRNTLTRHPMISLEDVSDSSSESQSSFHKKETHKKIKIIKESGAKQIVNEKFNDQSYGIEGWLRLCLRFVLHFGFGLFIFCVFHDSYLSTKNYSSKTINDILLISEINQNLNLIKIYQSQLLFGAPCSNCGKDLLLASLEYIRATKNLGKSLEEYEESDFDSVKALNYGVDNNYCAYFIKISETLDPEVKQALCSTPFNFTHSLEVSIFQTFDYFDSMWKDNKNFTKKTEIWEKVNIAEFSFAELSVQISTMLSVAITNWTAGHRNFLVMISIILMILKGIGLLLFVLGIKRSMTHKISSRNQVLKILKAPVLANNQEVAKICGFNSNDSN